MKITPCVLHYLFINEIEHKLYSFFIDQDTALKNEEINKPGHLELIFEIYQLYSLYKIWVKQIGIADNDIQHGTLFDDKLRSTIRQISNQKEMIDTTYRLFSQQKHFLDVLPPRPEEEIYHVKV